VRQLAPGSLRLPVAAAVATVTSAICLGPTFLTGAWFFPSVFAVVAVALGCEVARRVSTSPATVPLGGLVALLAYLLLRWGRDEAYFSVIPSSASLDRLGDLAASGRADIERYAAPIGVSPGVQFLTVAGIGLVALAVDTLAVTWRRAALAGLPLLALYTVPTAVAPDGVNWVAFAVGAIGFMALLLAEARERVSRWGRPMRYIAERANWRPEVETAPLAQVGRRVGATALGLALVVPAVLPDLSGASFGFGGGFGFGSGGGGGNRIAVVNPILDLGKNLRRAEDRVVIQYTGRPTYLRLVGADEFTGDQWRPSELQVSRDDNNVEDGLRRPPGLGSDVDTTSRRYRIEVGDLEQNWLPLPYPAQRVQIDGTWLYDESTFNVFGENASTRRLTYEARALDVRPTPAQLRSAPDAPDSMGRYLQLPDDLPSEVALQASRVVKGLPTAYDQALALQDWLRSDEFTYSTEVAGSIGDGNGSAAILGFLETRAGYCVHFASTMAVMARLLDIPARVAVGFTRGTPTGDGSWLVGLHDAHSWPELFFQGVGWVAFEPTPGERTGDPPPWADSNAAGGPGAPNPTASAEPTTGATPGPQNPRATEGRQDLLEELTGQQGGGGGAIGAGPVQIPVVPLAIGLGVLVLLSVPAVTRVVVRRRRWAGAATAREQARAAWADLQDTLVDHGYEWQASDSPRAGVARLVQTRELDPEATEAGRRLASATELARYAPVMPETVSDLRADVETVRAGLAATASTWARWRARLLPRSTQAVSRAMGERFADGLDAVDAAVASVTGRLKPGRS
jgi:transglutaminase-like putative cysteine protease